MGWLLAFAPAVFVCQRLAPEAHTLPFLLSVLAIKTGDMVGGLLDASSANLTELVIALAALRAGQRACRLPCCSWPLSPC